MGLRVCEDKGESEGVGEIWSRVTFTPHRGALLGYFGLQIRHLKEE